VLLQQGDFDDSDPATDAALARGWGGLWLAPAAAAAAAASPLEGLDGAGAAFPAPLTLGSALFTVLATARVQRGGAASDCGGGSGAAAETALPRAPFLSPLRGRSRSSCSASKASSTDTPSAAAPAPLAWGPRCSAALRSTRPDGAALGRRARRAPAGLCGSEGALRWRRGPEGSEDPPEETRAPVACWRRRGPRDPRVPEEFCVERVERRRLESVPRGHCPLGLCVGPPSLWQRGIAACSGQQPPCYRAPRRRGGWWPAEPLPRRPPTRRACGPPPPPPRRPRPLPSPPPPPPRHRPPRSCPLLVIILLVLLLLLLLIIIVVLLLRLPAVLALRLPEKLLLCPAPRPTRDERCGSCSSSGSSSIQVPQHAQLQHARGGCSQIVADPGSHCPSSTPDPSWTHQAAPSQWARPGLDARARRGDVARPVRERAHV